MYVGWLIHSISRHGFVLKSREITEEAVSLLKIGTVPCTRAGRNPSYLRSAFTLTTVTDREVLSASS